MCEAESIFVHLQRLPESGEGRVENRVILHSNSESLPDEINCVGRLMILMHKILLADQDPS